MNPSWWQQSKLEIDALAKEFPSRLEGKLSDIQKVLLKKNPFLFSIRTTDDPNVLAKMVVEAHISSSEETMFGNLIEDIAIAVCGHAKGGKKSAASGIDLEYDEGGERTIIQVKSGPRWGNSDQRKKLEDNFGTAQKRLRQSNSKIRVRCVEGISYGRSGIIDKGHYYKITGNAFWKDISGWDGTAKAIIQTLNSHAKNGMQSSKNNAADVIVDFLQKNGATKGGKIQWDVLLSLVMHENQN